MIWTRDDPEKHYFLVVFTLIGVSGAYAQEISTEEPAPISTSVAANAPLPASTRLTGLRAVYQQFNRCSAAALTIQLSYLVGKVHTTTPFEA